MNRDSARAAWLRLALGLALTPCAAGLVAALCSNAHVTQRVVDAVVFAGGALLPVLGLALAATCETTLTFALVLAGACGVLVLVFARFAQAHSAAPLLVNTSLVAIAWGLGSSLGRRVQHASHLLPACVVAACADLASVLSPEGPSHAIAQSDRALSLLATWFPEPGMHAVAPALGIGDLLFMALVFGVARRHALPYARTAVLCLLGTAVAGAAAAAFGVPVPALPAIGLCVLMGLPATRRLRCEDRRAARWAMIIACSLAFATIARNFWTPS
ncbi:MAG: hypothetical protein ABI548_16595 [Polyangiaceae bacterium]